ncbi:hypothetical protein PG985_007951 [Apiospora marii]|uniref:uncharacterized protein n=1 Tax=Apiospora marii TaxID=335849 RepID=UPI00312EDD28
MTDVEMSMDVATGYDPLAVQAKYNDYLNLDKSRNEFITHLDNYIVKIQGLEDNIKTLNDKSEKDNFKLSQFQIEAKSQLERLHALENERSKLQDENKELLNCLNDDYIDDPFVAVVVDGDGAIFTDELLNDPILAADRLKDAIRAQLREMTSLPLNIPIVVRIYANLQGLAKTISANGIISHTKMVEFPSRFNFECDSFDFIDVGRNKEAADSKIRTIFKHYLKNKQCRRIFLAGVSHDDGYVNDLKPFKDDQGERITLVESYKARPDFTRLGLPITSFPGVFRTQMLPSHGTAQPRRQSQEQQPLPPLQMAQDGPHENADAVNSNYAGLKEITSPALEDQTPNVRELLKDRRRARIYYNRNRVRIDAILEGPGDYDAPHQVSLRNKRESRNGRGFCNDYYLAGRCKRPAGACDLTHDVALTDKEKGVLRFLACRRWKCNKGVRCRDLSCYLPHTCPWPKYQCRDGNCKFEVHLEGGDESDERKPKYVLFDEREREIELQD